MRSGISIVIPSRPREDTLLACLNSIYQQSFQNFEVIVCFNPYQKMHLLACDFDGRMQISRSKKGANYARNKGLSLSNYNYVLFLDADCFLSNPDFLLNIYQVMENDPQLTAAGGPYQLPRSAGVVSQAYHFIQEAWLQESLLDSDLHIRQLLGGNMIFRKSILQGLCFDEALIFGGTEAEFFFRLKSRGHKILFLPELFVEHQSEITLKDFKRKAYMQGSGLRYILKKKIERSADRKFIFYRQTPAHLSELISIYRKEFSRGLHGSSLINMFFLLTSKIWKRSSLIIKLGLLQIVK